ncbi:AAA family ATPase [Corynebacterium variabile]|uniref:AAA family ATPase n=1 Tax=Corynebacterium variabile TaxID=1727 RepID=UPI003A93FB31
MLIELTVENFRSFRDATTLSMRSSREQRHNDRIARLRSRYRINVNPISVIYGANASGKTNITRSLQYLKSVILHQRSDKQLLPMDRFKLNAESINRPSRFSITFLDNNDIMYNYYISILDGKVEHEELYRILSRREELIYERSEETEFGRSINSNFVKALGSLASPNTPLPTLASKFIRSEKNAGLQEAIDELELIAKPHTWLRNVLLIGPNRNNNPAIGIHLLDEYNLDWTKQLKSIDAGITGVEVIDVSARDLGISETEESEISDSLEEGSVEFSESGGAVFSIHRKNGELQFKEYRLAHSTGKQDRSLEWRDESDGTRRMFSLIPPLFILESNSPDRYVVILDEIDRSLHTHLSKSLVNSFLKSCSGDTRNQLIITTHDVMLMDPDVFRRDEIWIVEKESDGNSDLRALSEYEELRKDTDLRQSYLEGRFGGIPNVGEFNFEENNV